MAGIGAGLAALNLGARLTGVRAFVERVPRWVWIALAIAAILVAGWIWHGRQMAAHDADLTARVTAARDAQWQKRLDDAHADALRQRGDFDAAAKHITELQRKLTDEENRHIAADRADLRLHGPGKAAAAPGCRPGDHPGLAGIAGRPVAQPGPAAHAGTEVPAGDGPGQFAVVPWNWLVDVVAERDAFRIEAIGWRTRDYMLAQEWERMRQQQLRAAGMNPAGTQSTLKGTPQ